MIALSLGKPTAAIFSAIVFGACLGFLRHNFFPARIFMGDSGALLLGFSLATVSVEGLLKTAADRRPASSRCSCSPCRSSTPASSSPGG